MENYSTARADFRRARGRAALQSILARLTGGKSELLSYEDVRRKVRASGVVSRSVQEVPLDAIVGSVGRYNDFTRTFLPKLDSDQDRWARVKAASTGTSSGLPPVELYQIGKAYFVADGHHRISVARTIGQKDIQAYVTEVRSKVPLEADSQADDLILKAEEAEFLARTTIDEMYPGIDLRVTCPGRYHTLIDHIDVHRHYMGLEQQREIPYPEAVSHWYEHVYSPIVRIINDQGIMHDFPGRTEADLYVWIGRHRADLEEQLGWDVPVGPAAADLADSEGKGSGNIISRLGQRVLEVVIPDDLEDAPKAGQWRRERSAEEDKLFAEILVGISGQDSSWLALEQAIPIARRENSRVSGLYVVKDERRQESKRATAIRDRFYWRCGEVGVPGRFATDVGPVAKTLCSRARWSDLLIVNLAHRPGASPLERWTSGFRKLAQRCSRPILAVPDQVTDLAHPLLIFDGSPQALEALYVAAYMADEWQRPLHVLIVESGDREAQNAETVNEYLTGHSISATFLSQSDLEAATILSRANELGNDLLIIGTLDTNPLVGAVAGSALTDLLANTNLPVLICR
jgi:nucleotide-binding universal stress UspA family protein